MPPAVYSFVSVFIALKYHSFQNLLIVTIIVLLIVSRQGFRCSLICFVCFLTKRRFVVCSLVFPRFLRMLLFAVHV